MPDKEISPWDEIFGPPEEEKEEKKKEEKEEETFFLVEEEKKEEKEEKEGVSEEKKEEEALLSITEKKEERGEVDILSFQGTPDRFQERSLESLEEPLLPPEREAPPVEKEETPPPAPEPAVEEKPEFERYLALIHDLLSHRYYEPARKAIQEMERRFPRT